ncbi:MAG: HD domain-containing phosphohydrolase [Candidatus Zipacnadales bacterium]
MSTEKARVIVVDDESYVREIIARWLSANGYECCAAESAGAALEIIAKGGVSLVLSDINMPGASGLDLLATIRAQFPDIAVLLVTALDDREVAVRALEQGAYGYIIKPFERNEILISVAAALERRRLTQIAQIQQHYLEREVDRRTADVRRREMEIVHRLLSVVRWRHDETAAHLRRIGEYVTILGKQLGWDQEVLNNLRMAAPTHDIGKIGVSDSVLLKPGKLSAAEFRSMQRHTVIGADILGDSTIPMLRMGHDIALAHHENWDGSGYPHGKAGEMIPATARLVSIVDVYDALTHDRVYRPALPEKVALQIMCQGKGTRFDPVIFDAFLQVLPQLRIVRERFTDEDHLSPEHPETSQTDLTPSAANNSESPLPVFP